MLTRQEKDDLMTVINILFDDNQLRGLKPNLNERTAEVVEQAMEEGGGDRINNGDFRVYPRLAEALVG